MLAFLEIARAAFLSLGRRLGPWLLGLAALAAVGWFADNQLTRVLILIGGSAMVAAAIPAVAGTGLRNWLRAGPLGLAARGGGYFATVGYGVGAALVALPFVLAAAAVAAGSNASLSELQTNLTLAAVGVLVCAWLGAAAGRMVETGPAVVMLSWVGAALVTALAYCGMALLREALPASELGTSLFESVGPSAGALVAVLGTHLVMVGASFADQRRPTHPEL